MVDVKMNYGSMEKMKTAFKQAGSQLDQTMGEMKKLAKMMQDGALQGDGGSAFADAVNRKLMKRMKALHEKMIQMQGDIQAAVDAKKEGVTTAKGRFSN
jgi:uncharacterized protein YukE